MIFKHQQLAQAIALILISTFFIFIAGYYWGKKSALENFSAQFEQDSFADKVSYSLCSLYDQPDSETDSETANQDSESQDSESSDSENAGDDLTDNQANAYLAQLAGFGSNITAKKFVDLLKQKGFKVNIAEKKSRTSKGKIITWYQVVTDYFSDEKELLKFIDKINKISKLTDVKVVTLKPETTSERQNT
ncbi:SPOR domain-containing protein [Candidatus Dependentiae bacterium]|nr:SPOR domain-containing protein [Candidatus Dependentiae bacterium]